ncbi:Testis-expressed sequence 264 protein, partial [Stegodyphus mimosarum]
MILAKGFQITKFPSVEYVVYADFPHTNFLSVLIAVHRVIPAFREYIQEKKLQAYPLIEICDGLLITYLAPLSKQSEFFVYEALAESEEEVTSEKTVDEADEASVKDLEELPDTISSVDSLVEGGSKVEELPSNEEVLDSLEEKNKTAGNGSEASTESFEELQLDS